jgi:hypothetical protein
VVQADDVASFPSGAYARFRWLWLLARDWTPLQPEERLMQFELHANLHAPVQSHYPRKLAERMHDFVLPPSAPLQQQQPSSSQSPSPQPSSPSSPSPSSPLSSSSLASGSSDFSAAGASSSSFLSSRFHEALQASTTRVGLLPEAPLVATDPSSASADALSQALLRVLVHAHACARLGWSLDARSWDVSSFSQERWTAAVDAATAIVQQWLMAHLVQRRRYVEFALRMYREWMPARSALMLWSRCLPFDWRDPSFQAALVHLVLRDSYTAEFPPSLEYRWGFWSAILSELERAGVDIDDELAGEVQALLRQKSKMQANNQSLVAASQHWTVAYPEGGDASDSPPKLRTLTLRLSAGFGSMTGLTLWPAGFLMCEYILAHPERFRGKRVLELGIGIGMTG